MPVGIGTSITASQRVSTTLPTGAGNNLSAALNLTPQGGRGQGSLKLQISVPAIPAMTGGNFSFTLEDCDTEGGTYAAVEGYGAMVATAGGGGLAAKSWLLRLHDHVRQFVKLRCTLAAPAGTVSGASVFETIFQG